MMNFEWWKFLNDELSFWFLNDEMFEWRFWMMNSLMKFWTNCRNWCNFDGLFWTKIEKIIKISSTFKTFFSTDVFDASIRGRSSVIFLTLLLLWKLNLNNIQNLLNFWIYFYKTHQIGTILMVSNKNSTKKCKHFNILINN